MKCDVCKKETNCSSWDYIVKKEVVGRVRTNTPGVDTVYKVGGRETGRESNTTYKTGTSIKSINKGTAYLCSKCRILWSIILTIVFSIMTVILTLLFLKGLNILFKTEGKVSIMEVLSKVFIYSIPIFLLLSITPLMKHIILAIHKSKEYKVMPWNIVSKFWE